jgi:uroporphyrinogen decarboxylase
MTSRERWHLAITHQEADRIPIADTLWPTTVERWRREGLPADADLRGYFGYEWAHQGVDLSFQLRAETLEETERYRIIRDAFGATTRVFVGQESVPELLGHTITSRAAWEEHKPLLAWNDSRVNWEPALAENRRLREQGLWVSYIAGFGYDLIQRFVGNERTLIAMLEEPAWVRDMMVTIGEAVAAGLEQMLARGFRFDGAFIWNDQAYRNGPFFSPACWREFEFPVQKRLCDLFHHHGMAVVQHTDGDVRPLIPAFIEAGFDCLQPCEVKAGMDLVELKRDFGDRLAFMGGIDVRAMAHPDPSVIEQEIARKIPVAKRGGGYIYHSDHSVPDSVSWAQYQRVMELVAHYGRF